MGRKVLHIATCDCCGRAWQSESFNKVEDKFKTYEFNNSGVKPLVLCKECGTDVEKAVETIYHFICEGKTDITLYGYEEYGRTSKKIINLDVEVDE